MSLDRVFTPFSGGLLRSRCPSWPGGYAWQGGEGHRGSAWRVGVLAFHWAPDNPARHGRGRVPPCCFLRDLHRHRAMGLGCSFSPEGGVSPGFLLGVP